MKKKILVAFVALFLAFQFTVSASSSYSSYVYDTNGEFFSAPDAFYFSNQIDLKNMKTTDGKKVGLSNPNDVYVSSDNLIYISGTDENDNGMVLVLNKDYTFNKLIKSFKNTITLEDGSKKTINDKFGIATCTFIDSVDGSIYICDQNGAKKSNSDFKKQKYIQDDTSGRIIKMKPDGTVEMIISAITNEILPKDFDFQPTNVVVDKAGRIFVLSQGFEMGIMELDSEGDFVQTLGAPSVTYNVLELFWRKINTDEQNKRSVNFVPTEYSGIDIDEDGFLYVTNSTFDKSNYQDVNGLSKLNSKGADVLRTTGSTTPFGDTDASWKGTLEGVSRLTDVVTLDYDMYAVLDELRGKVFFYNVDGINLFEFGTSADDPDSDHVTYIEGNASVFSSVEWINDCCIVTDYDIGMLNIYSMTDYAKQIFTASKLHYEDKYDDEVEIWKDVLKLNNNSVAAKQNIAKVYYRNKDWKTAMTYFKSIKDQENYSKAYKYQRQEYIEKYFNIAVAIIVLLIVAIALFKRWRRKHKKETKPGSYLAHLKFAKVILFRPLHGNWILTRENNSSIASATTILVAVSFMSLFQARFTGFIFNADAERVNILLEFAKICLPVLLFSVCNWCVTSLMAGEGNFKSIYISVCYSLTPILILYPIAILLSNIMVLEEGNFYTTFITLALIWVLALIFFGNMRIHDYNLGMAVLEIVITIVVMILIVFLAILFFALIQQMASFVGRIIEELATR